MTNIQIIGATGNIGKRLVEKGPENVNIISLRLDNTPLEYDFDTLEVGDTVVFCAAISEPSVCVNEFERALQINVESTGDFIQQALDRSCKVIFLSSDVVYGAVEGDFDESQPVNPKGAYGEMKALIEKRFVDRPGFKILRLSYNFFRDDRFTKYLLGCAERNTIAEIFDPFARSVIHRDDTVDVILSLANNWDICEEQIINCGGPQTISRLEFASILGQKVIKDLMIKDVNPGEKFYEDRPAVISMRSPVLEKILGRPVRFIEEAVDLEFSIVETHRDNK